MAGRAPLGGSGCPGAVGSGWISKPLVVQCPGHVFLFSVTTVASELLDLPREARGKFKGGCLFVSDSGWLILSPSLETVQEFGPPWRLSKGALIAELWESLSLLPRTDQSLTSREPSLSPWPSLCAVRLRVLWFVLSSLCRLPCLGTDRALFRVCDNGAVVGRWEVGREHPRWVFILGASPLVWSSWSIRGQVPAGPKTNASSLWALDLNTGLWGVC